MTLYKEGSDYVSLHQAMDEEKVVLGELHDPECKALDTVNKDVLKLEKSVNTDVFSWKGIEYEVPVSGGMMRKLLDDVSGYVAPGKLTALIGESGAGKVYIRAVSLHSD